MCANPSTAGQTSRLTTSIIMIEEAVNAGLEDGFSKLMKDYCLNNRACLYPLVVLISW